MTKAKDSNKVSEAKDPSKIFQPKSFLRGTVSDARSSFNVSEPKIPTRFRSQEHIPTSLGILQDVEPKYSYKSRNQRILQGV